MISLPKPKEGMLFDLPDPFAGWFDSKGWSIRHHQAEMLQRADELALLMTAPTGGGKTLAGFLPSLMDLADGGKRGLDTLYVSPLKALAADIRRNLETPVAEMNLPIRIEDRTGDTSQWHRRRQRVDPPHILLTTPESLALMLSYEEAPRIFRGLKRVIVDEIHALAESKRGDQLMLGLARLQTLSPCLKRVGLSATVRDPREMADFLACHPHPCRIIASSPSPSADIGMLETDSLPPWSGGGGRYAASAVMDAIANARLTLVFINTRAQAELFFQALWNVNSSNLPIAIHHGSLSREARLRVEAAMVEGRLRAVVCTGTLDLGIDWGDVDLVIQVGAPKNVKRLVQRIGRSNHRFEVPSRALVVPANRFEVVECKAALEAVACDDLDGEPKGPGSLDVVCQQMLILACSGPLDADALFAEFRTAGPYLQLSREDFDSCLDFCATGGYALKAYEKWQRLVQTKDGVWRFRDPRSTRSVRMNIGTIVDTETLKVRMVRRRGGAPLGEVEEAFAATLTPGDTFLIGGETVRYESIREMTVEVSREPGKKPKVAVFSGTKFSTSTLLCDRVLDLLQPASWLRLPESTRDWFQAQREHSKLPRRNRLLVESFSHARMQFTCIYGFAGRNAHQTLGLLLTQRMERTGLHPLGMIASDYALMIWSLERIADLSALLAADGLREGLETWLAGNAVMKRTFRGVATIAGLIERTQPGKRRTGRQVTFSTDILYDTLRKHDPNHLLLRVTHEEAMRGLVDFARIEEMIDRISGRFDYVRAPGVTPFAAPLLLEVGSVPIKGQAEERLLREEAERILSQAARPKASERA